MKSNTIDCLDDTRSDIWKSVYYQFHDLIEKNRIFSKIPNRIIIRAYYSDDYLKVKSKVLDVFKNIFVVPTLIIWNIFLKPFEQSYHTISYPEVKMLKNIQDNKFDYLFVLNTKDHIISSFPVIEKLSKSRRILIVTFKNVYLRHKYDFDNFNNVGIVFFERELKDLSLSTYLKVMSESKNYASILFKSDISDELKEIIAKDSPFIRNHLKEELIQYYLFDKIFSLYDLKGVISIVFTTAFEIATDKSIPTFIIQHGIGGGGHLPYISKYIFAYDKPTETELNKWTDNTVKIFPLGAPRYDYLKNLRVSNSNKFKKMYNIHESGKIITFVSEGDPYDNNLTLLSLKKLCSIVPDSIKIIIKLHPRENLHESNIKKSIEDIFDKNELNHVIFIRNEVDFYDVLSNTDIVISTVSTGISESIAMDIPVFQINFTGRPYPPNLDLSFFGGMEPINDIDSLIENVSLALKDNIGYNAVLSRQEKLKTQMFENFGLTGELISNTIIQISEFES